MIWTHFKRWMYHHKDLSIGCAAGKAKDMVCSIQKHWNKWRSKIPNFVWPTRVRVISPRETTSRIAVATSSLTPNSSTLWHNRIFRTSYEMPGSGIGRILLVLYVKVIILWDARVWNRSNNAYPICEHNSIVTLRIRGKISMSKSLSWPRDALHSAQYVQRRRIHAKVIRLNTARRSTLDTQT